jgi:hypothetical protein
MFQVRTHETRTLSWWHTNRDDIDFSPPYQRKGGLWTPGDKAYLIDSILNGYDIPKVYLADFTISNSRLNAKKKPYSIIDGRQRFEAIFDFLDNRLPLNDDFLFDSDPSLFLGGLFYTDLRKNYPKIASKVEQFNLHVMSVMTDEEGKINDLFVRLNRSRPLTGAEIRNAMPGIVPDLIRNITGHRFFDEWIKFSKNRGQDKNTAAKLLLLEFRCKLVDTKKFQLDRFVDEGVQSETNDFCHAANRVMQVLDDMCCTFGKKDTLLSSEGPTTLYYWFIREHGPQPNFRQFLSTFDKARKVNNALANKSVDNVDQELLAFNVLNRSTNDQGSLIKRYQILDKRYSWFNKYGSIGSPPESREG